MELKDLPTVAIVGAGFGGLWAAKALRKAPVRVVLIDRTNHHVFQPLLYQVATAGLSPADIAHPVRSVLRSQANLEVIMAEAVGVDVPGSALLARVDEAGSDLWIPFDWLVLAPGATNSYFGHDEWAEQAPSLKTLADALHIRARILLAFERAETAATEEERDALLTFVVVGGGPTGVELAGAIAEIAFLSMSREFDHIDPDRAQVILVEAGSRLLPSFPEDLSEATARGLEKLGVKVQVGRPVASVDEGGVHVGETQIRARTVLWAAGNKAQPVAEWLGAEADRQGRVKVMPDCSVPGMPNIFVIGDAAFLEQDGKPLQGVAQVAMQQGAYVANVIRRRVLNSSHPESAFRYRDKGIMATIGRRSAVAVVGRMHLKGIAAWLAWLALHIWYLIGFRNRVLVLFQWIWSYFTFKRGARLILPDSRK